MPKANQMHVDKLLGNVSVKYKNAEYIADQVFPKVPVKTDSDVYRVYARNFRVPETKRANKGLAKEHEFDVSTAGYQLQNHALKDYISDDDKDNYDQASLEQDTVEELTDTIDRRKELSVAQLFTTTSWSLNVSLAATAAFNLDTTVSNPIPIFDTASTTMLGESGFMPNYGILPRAGMIGCKNHQSVHDRLKYTTSEIDAVKLAALFGVPQLLIPTAQYDSAAKGATSVIAPIWGDSAFLGYKPERPSLKRPSAGYTFEKAAPRVKRWRDEERESDGIKVEIKYVPKVVASLAGYLIKDIV